MIIKKGSILLLLAGVVITSSLLGACSKSETTNTAEKPVSNVFVSGNCQVTASPETDLSPGDTVNFKVRIQAGDWEAHISEIEFIPENSVEKIWPRSTLFEQNVNWPEWVYRGGATDDREVSITIPQGAGGQAGILLSIRYEFAVAEYDPDYYPPNHYVVDYGREYILIPLNLPRLAGEEEPKTRFGDAIELAQQTTLTVESIAKTNYYAFLFTRLETEYRHPYVSYWLVDDAGRCASRIDGPNNYSIYDIEGFSPGLNLYTYYNDKLVRVYLGTESTEEPFTVQDWSFPKPERDKRSYTTTLDLNLKYTTPLSCTLTLLSPDGDPVLNALGEPVGPITTWGTERNHEATIKMAEESWQAVTPGKSFTLEVREQYTDCLIATEFIENKGGQITIEDVELCWWYDLVASAYKLQEIRIHTHNSGGFPVPIGLAYSKIDVPYDEDYHPFLSLIPPYIIPGDDVLTARTLGWWLPSAEKELTIVLFAGDWDMYEIPYRGHYDPYERTNQENYEFAAYQCSIIEPTTPPSPATEHGPAFSATAPAKAAVLNGPWPTFGHDLQRTGQSPYTGPEHPVLKWKIDLIGGGYMSNIPGFASIAADGTMYFSNPWGLSAANADGKVQWRYTISGGNALTVSPDNIRLSKKLF